MPIKEEMNTTYKFISQGKEQNMGFVSPITGNIYSWPRETMRGSRMMTLSIWPTHARGYFDPYLAHEVQYMFGTYCYGGRNHFLKGYSTVSWDGRWGSIDVLEQHFWGLWTFWRGPSHAMDEDSCQSKLPQKEKKRFFFSNVTNLSMRLILTCATVYIVIAADKTLIGWIGKFPWSIIMPQVGINASTPTSISTSVLINHSSLKQHQKVTISTGGNPYKYRYGPKRTMAQVRMGFFSIYQSPLFILSAQFVCLKGGKNMKKKKLGDRMLVSFWDS